MKCSTAAVLRQKAIKLHTLIVKPMFLSCREEDGGLYENTAVEMEAGKASEVKQTSL
jgi:hypothetical protein